MAGSASSDGWDKDDLCAIGERCGPRGEFSIDGYAETIGRKREGVTRAEFVVELRSGSGGGGECFGAEAALFAKDGEVLEVDGFQNGKTASRSEREFGQE